MNAMKKLFTPTPNYSIPLALKLMQEDCHSMEAFLSVLDGYESGDADSFAVIIQKCGRHGVGMEHIRDRIKVSTGTISRWANWISRPHTYMRESVVADLRTLVEERLKALKASLEKGDLELACHLARGSEGDLLAERERSRPKSSKKKSKAKKKLPKTRRIKVVANAN